MTPQAEHPTGDKMPDRDPLAKMVADAFRQARAAGVGIDAAADIVAAVIRDRIDTESLEDVSAADIVHVQSILSHRSGEPLVQVRTGSMRWQWTPTEARGHALHLLEVAEAATYDAAFYRWMTLSKMEAPPEFAIASLFELRRFRGDVAPADWRTPQ